MTREKFDTAFYAAIDRQMNGVPAHTEGWKPLIDLVWEDLQSAPPEVDAWVYWSAPDQNGETQHYRCTVAFAGELLTKVHRSLGWIAGQDELRHPPQNGEGK